MSVNVNELFFIPGKDILTCETGRSQPGNMQSLPVELKLQNT